MQQTASEIVEIAPTTSVASHWQPIVGQETLDLLEHLRLTQESRDRVCAEAVDILAQCLAPSETSGQETGLVVGYVQSGKTMSFTTVAALARDNGFAVVVVIAGTSVPLLEQSTRRLEGDLRINNRHDRAWLHVSSDIINKSSNKTGLKDTVAEWHDSAVPKEERRTILITAMKHHVHLKKVIKALQGLDLDGLPALIIDDEADQASLNALVLKNDESTTYRRIKELRSVFPHHTYLQYTATPQAPLLINIIDTLSPRFAEVLTPGPDYAGGIHFFAQNPELIEIIPDDELLNAGSGEPPESLLAAMRLFLVGVAAGLILDKGMGNRSMMVHPSQRTSGHSEYHGWVQQIWETWKLLLDPSSDDEDRKELLEDFQEAHADLAKTADDLPPFDEIAAVLHRAVRKTMIEEINAASGPTPKIPWRNHYGWILVGGQAMDRGFTVEGLTVTYMPRSIGIGNADTVQQRARFFGYKRKYLGYCRVFLERATFDAYDRYVQHEEDVRRRLIAHRATGAPLTAWKRQFFLDGALQPTRKSVLDIAFARASGESEWYWMKMPHESEAAIISNRAVVNQFIGARSFSTSPGSPERTKYQVHQYTEMSLRIALEDLLTKLQVTHTADSSEFTLLQLLISEHVEKVPDAKCIVYVMSSGELRERSLNSKGEITNLFQGAYPSKPKGAVQVGDIYPGDREIATAHDCTVIQIHRLEIKGEKDKPLASDVPTIAVHVPASASGSLLVQSQPTQLPQ
jgi:Z1 domain